MRPKWQLQEKIFFFISYIFFKSKIIFEVFEPRWLFLFFEFKYSFQNFFNHFFSLPLPVVLWPRESIIHTKYGKFFVRAMSHDAAIISPAFERLDINKLLHLISSELKKNKALFIDIGANIGKYSVTVSHEIQNSNLRVLAFEPNHENFSILKKNIELNSLQQQTHCFPNAIGAKNEKLPLFSNSTRPGNSSFNATVDPLHHTSSEVSVITLDEALAEENTDQVLFIKIDIEGHEPQAIIGAQKTLSSFKKIYILIEDAINREEIYLLLSSVRARPICKLSSYNSWWELKNI